MSKIVGVVPTARLFENDDPYQDNYVFVNSYIQRVAEAGGVPVGLLSVDGTLAPGALERCDALLLCGGRKIWPYHIQAVEHAARTGKPVLGVCRGLQLINIWAGGTLLQDLGARNGAHRWAGADRAHPVHTAEDSLLRRLYGVHFWVNSAHHQALELPGAGLRVTARAPDGVVEAIAHSTLPLWAVQFHPERMRPALGWPGAADGTALLRYFVRRCAGACISEENGVC